MSAPRYAICIGLGTTNCARAYVDLRAPHGRVELLSLPQLHAIDAVVDSPLLPSFFYLSLIHIWTLPTSDLV